MPGVDVPDGEGSHRQRNLPPHLESDRASFGADGGGSTRQKKKSRRVFGPEEIELAILKNASVPLGQVVSTRGWNSSVYRIIRANNPNFKIALELVQVH